MRKQISTLLALLIVALGATTGNASAAGWQPSVNAATGDNGLSAVVGVDAQGNAVGVWARHVSGLDWQIVAATRSLGGKWTTPVDLSGAQRTVLLRPKVAVDPLGNAVAVWLARPPQAPGNEAVSRALWAASRPPGGTWSAPVEISPASGGDAFDVVIDGSGNATAVWASFNEGEDEEPGVFVRAASRPLGGEWSEPVELSGSNGANPQVAVNPDGDVTAAWIGSDPDTDNLVVRSKSRPAGGAWSAAATDLSSDAGNASAPQVAVGPQGDATAAWSYSEDDDIVVQAAHRSGGTWSEPVELWDDAADTALPDVALVTDPQSDTTAIWSSFAPGGHVMRASTSTAGGAWSSPVALSAPDGGDKPNVEINPRIVADPQGNLTATWSAAVGPSPGIGIPEDRRLQAVHRPAGGAWGSPVPLSAPDDVWAAEIAADSQGYVTALWVGGTSAVMSRVYDPIAPLLQNVTVPAIGVVGEPVAMSVSPFDVWSSVTTGWDFGDGDSSSGATAGHCYSTPGDHTVTITGTDLAANTASATQTIDIEADPEAGPDPCAPPDPGSDPGSNPGPGPDPDPRTGTDPGPGTDSSPIAPIVTGLQQSSSRWRTRALDRLPQLPVGTVFRFRLNRAANVTLPLVRIAPGGKTKPRGALRMTGDAGTNTFAFRGKIRGRTLAPGRYRLTVTAHADGMTSPSASIGFTIVR